MRLVLLGHWRSSSSFLQTPTQQSGPLPGSGVEGTSWSMRGRSSQSSGRQGAVWREESEEEEKRVSRGQPSGPRAEGSQPCHPAEPQQGSGPGRPDSGTSKRRWTRDSDHCPREGRRQLDRGSLEPFQKCQRMIKCEQRGEPRQGACVGLCPQESAGRRGGEAFWQPRGVRGTTAGAPGTCHSWGSDKDPHPRFKVLLQDFGIKSTLETSQLFPVFELSFQNSHWC